MKTCTTCLVEQPLENFHRAHNGGQGRKGKCKPCLAVQRKAYDQRPERLEASKAYYFQWKYGITAEHYEDMLASQNGVCAICKMQETRLGRSQQVKPLAVDHDHQTGEVRGLLCDACNVSLGAMKDSIETLQSAIAYLSKWGVKDD